ncbi:hypothetical protein E2N92_13165 [Methanofollis formosanus]|uniref:Uncharacterized protein n=1 Tax=Methanofollis formosanus TaxID=299308 RepID=A0A8G1EGZ4_9EURY|nr:hypothetical protein [Methanofollis formosanus]QYZ80310.1 hypothetical protein E2N92_13165 [Methanofollis formosanus]
MKLRLLATALLLTFVVAFVGLGVLLVFHPGHGGPQVSLEIVPPDEIPAVVREAERHFTSNLTGAVAGDATLVRSLDRNIRDFYLVPFHREEVTAVAQISVSENGTPDFSQWRHDLSGTVAWMHPPFTAAILMLRNAGYTGGKWKARMVSVSGGEPVMPYFWEFEEEAGERVYIGYDQKNDEIKLYSKLVPDLWPNDRKSDPQNPRPDSPVSPA